MGKELRSQIFSALLLGLVIIVSSTTNLHAQEIRLLDTSGLVRAVVVPIKGQEMEVRIRIRSGSSSSKLELVNLEGQYAAMQPQSVEKSSEGDNFVFNGIGIGNWRVVGLASPSDLLDVGISPIRRN